MDGSSKLGDMFNAWCLLLSDRARLVMIVVTIAGAVTATPPTGEKFQEKACLLNIELRRQQHGDEDSHHAAVCLRYGNTLVKPPPTPRPMLLETPLEMAAPLPIEAAPLTALL